jgi:hypothetical protein
MSRNPVSNANNGKLLFKLRLFGVALSFAILFVLSATSAIGLEGFSPRALALFLFAMVIGSVGVAIGLALHLGTWPALSRILGVRGDHPN